MAIKFEKSEVLLIKTPVDQKRIINTFDFFGLHLCVYELFGHNHFTTIA